MQRGKFYRPIIKRIIMGPAEDFSKEKVQEDLTRHHSLTIWGLLLLHGNTANPMDFFNSLGLDVEPNSETQPFVAFLNPAEGKDLSKPSSWSDSGYLKFVNEENLKACGKLWGRVFACFCISNTHCSQKS